VSATSLRRIEFYCSVLRARWSAALRARCV
jgi:hypothetical protein